METEQQAGSYPALGQTAVRTWLSPNTRGVSWETTSRFQGDGVRYRAKLIGVDPLPDAHGDKIFKDSMMKLKGFEISARRQGIHKQRVWLKISSSGLKILDERTGAVIYDHDKSRISYLKKDESDPRALAYIYQHQDTYFLFYIKTATLADPVVADIHEVCKVVESEEAPTQTDSILLLNGFSPPPVEVSTAENVSSPQPVPSLGELNQTSSTNELMEVFSVQMLEPMMPTQSSCTTQPGSPQPVLPSPQIAPMFPMQPVGGSPYPSSPFPTTTMPWRHPGLMGNQWTSPAVAPWPTMPGSMPTWVPGGIAAPPAGSQVQVHVSQPGLMTCSSSSEA